MDEETVRSELRRIASERERLTAQVAALDDERGAVVRAGFAAGLSASSMVSDAGLSQQRLSQILRGGRK